MNKALENNKGMLLRTRLWINFVAELQMLCSGVMRKAMCSEVLMAYIDDKHSLAPVRCPQLNPQLSHSVD